MKRRRRIARGVLLAVAAGLVYWFVVAKILKRLFPFPVSPIFGRFLDSGVRHFFEPPAPTLIRSGIAPDQHVLELGCGSGAYTTLLARAVQPLGRVIAVDLQWGMVAQTARKLRRPAYDDIENVTIVQASAYALPFADGALAGAAAAASDARGAFDIVTMTSVLPEIPDQVRALAEVRRVLRPGGHLALTEFFPDPDYPFKGETVRRGTAAGFELAGVDGSFWTYTARLRKARTSSHVRRATGSS